MGANLSDAAAASDSGSASSSAFFSETFAASIDSDASIRTKSFSGALVSQNPPFGNIKRKQQKMNAENKRTLGQPKRQFMIVSLTKDKMLSIYFKKCGLKPMTCQANSGNRPAT